MRYAIISDIHSNIEALKEVVKNIKKYKVDKIICIGDIVGYGPNPQECIKLLQTINPAVIMGNHDAAVIDESKTERFSEMAKIAINMNKKRISRKYMEYLISLKETFSENDILFVHGSPRDHLNEYLIDCEKLKINIDFIKEKICFVGHTHLPCVFCINETGKEEIINIDGNQKIILNDKLKYIINTGSVGQPRDYDKRSCFLYFDSSTKELQFRRIEYNVKKVQKKMRRLKLPEFLISRLEHGK